VARLDIPGLPVNIEVLPLMVRLARLRSLSIAAVLIAIRKGRRAALAARPVGFAFGHAGSRRKMHRWVHVGALASHGFLSGKRAADFPIIVILTIPVLGPFQFFGSTGAKS
jgi:hypothetical protein